MRNLHDIYSRIANDIQDNTYSLVTRGEYISIANNVANYLSKLIDIFVREFPYTAPIEQSFFVLPRQSSPYTTTNYMSTPTGDNYHINRLLKIVRHNQDCREVSFIAVESASRGNAAFKPNDTQLDYRFFATRLLPSNDIEITFVQPLALNETILIYALCDIPTQKAFSINNLPAVDFTPKWSEFKDYTPIPDVIVDAFYKVMLKEVLFVLLTRMGDVWANRYNIANQVAIRELYETRRYIRNAKDTSSFPQIQPLKWLSEERDFEPPNRANIPASLTTSIIL